MNFFASAYNLFFDQKSFFAGHTGKGIVLPAVLTLIYAAVSAVSAIPVLYTALGSIPAELGGLVVGISVVSSVIGALFVWVAVSALFFACLKFIGYAECSFTQVLKVCGYVSAILIPWKVFTGLISLIGTPAPILLLLLEGVFLLWSIPVWYFGFAKICDIPEKKLRTAVAVPVIVMAVFTVISSAGTILAF